MLIMKSQLLICFPLVAIILSTYQAAGTSAQESDPCYNHTILNDTWRGAGYNPDWANLKCDGDGNWRAGWYVFVHQDYSVQMPTSCVPPVHCGTAGAIWMNGPHPSLEDGIVTRQACTSWSAYCCHPSYPVPDIQVKACPGNYTVYRLQDPVLCTIGYCANFGSRGALPSSTTQSPPTTTLAPYVTEHVVGTRLTVSSAKRLNETEVEEKILKPLRELLTQQGIDVTGIRLRRLHQKQP